MLQKNIVFYEQAIGGSYAYSTNTTDSDLDVSGIALNSKEDILGLNNGFEQVTDKTTDTVIYSFNKMINATQLVSYHMTDLLDANKINTKYLLNKIGEEQLRRLILLRKCNYTCGTHLSLNQNRLLCTVQCAERVLDEIINNNECYSLKQLAVNGNDLIEHGIPQGKEVGNVLNALLNKVFVDNAENYKELLLQEVDRIATIYKNNN